MSINTTDKYCTHEHKIIRRHVDSWAILSEDSPVYQTLEEEDSVQCSDCGAILCRKSAKDMTTKS